MDQKYPKVNKNYPKVLKSDEKWHKFTKSDQKSPKVSTSDQKWLKFTKSDQKWQQFKKRKKMGGGYSVKIIIVTSISTGFSKQKVKVQSF